MGERAKLAVMSNAEPTTNFFATLPAVRAFEDVADLGSYHPAPDDWRVIITDVKGSTRAIEAGRYKEVNAMGAGSIVTVLNVAGGVDIPYVFGGDGATLLIPPALEDAARRALAGLAGLARRCFDLELRVGLVPVAEVVERGAQLLVARYQVSEHVALAMLAGGGAGVAEKLVKDEEAGAAYRVEPSGDADGKPSLEGFNCRWNPIASRNGHTVSLLVAALDDAPDARHATYGRILGHVSRLDAVDHLHPVARESLELTDNLSSLDVETKLMTGKTRGPGFQLYRAKVAATVGIGRRLMSRGKALGGFDGTRYPDELIQQTDFRKFDDALRMVLDVSAAQLDSIRECLAEERRRGAIAYGLHVADSALMTCLVFDHQGRHVHFVDGADGGYAMASKQLKAQLRDVVDD